MQSQPKNPRLLLRIALSIAEMHGDFGLFEPRRGVRQIAQVPHLPQKYGVRPDTGREVPRYLVCTGKYCVLYGVLRLYFVPAPADSDCSVFTQVSRQYLDARFQNYDPPFHLH